MKTTIGTCSICKGPVTVPSVWRGVVPPTPSCAHCGATPSEPHGPTIQMQPRAPSTTTVRLFDDIVNNLNRAVVRAAVELARQR